MDKEPIGIIALVQAAIGAAIAMLVGFGLTWTGEQVSLVMAFVGALGACATWYLARKHTYSVSTVQTADRESTLPPV